MVSQSHISWEHEFQVFQLYEDNLSFPVCSKDNKDISVLPRRSHQNFEGIQIKELQ